MPETKPTPLSHPVGVLHEIRWNEIFPWLILVRSWRVSFMFRVLLLAWVGVLLTSSGWSVLGSLLSGTSTESDAQRELVEMIGDSQSMVPPQTPLFPWQGDSSLVQTWQWLSGPFLHLTNPETSLSDSFALLVQGIWAIAVWGFLGAAICRIAAMQLTRNEDIGIDETFQTSIKSGPACMGAPLLPLIAAILLSTPLCIFGWLIRLDFPLLVLGLVWIVILILGLLLAVILIGLLLGWPLMWSAIAVERSDAFDAISRAYSYIYQRPLHLAGFVIVSLLLGYVGGEIVSLFVMGAIHLSEWGTSWGTGTERLMEITDSLPKELSDNPLEGMGATGANLIHWWKSKWLAFIPSYHVAHLWSSAVGVYLLLRRYVDATEMDEIILTHKEKPQGLPELKENESGIPEVKQES